jgi:hypothetical protein
MAMLTAITNKIEKAEKEVEPTIEDVPNPYTTSTDSKPMNAFSFMN